MSGRKEPQAAYFYDVDEEGKPIQGSKQSARKKEKDRPKIRQGDSEKRKSSRKSHSDSGVVAKYEEGISPGTKGVEVVTEKLERRKSSASSSKSPKIPSRPPLSHENRPHPKVAIPRRDDPSHFGILIPIRPRALVSQTYPLRPLSYHAAYTSGGYGTGLPLSASAYYQQPIITPSSPSPSPSAYRYAVTPQAQYSYFDAQPVAPAPAVSRPLGARIDPIQRTSSAYGMRDITPQTYNSYDDDDGYRSASEGLSIRRAIIRVPTTSARTKAEIDYDAMLPPPRPSFPRRPATEYYADSVPDPPSYRDRDSRSMYREDPPPVRGPSVLLAHKVELVTPDETTLAALPRHAEGGDNPDLLYDRRVRGSSELGEHSSTVIASSDDHPSLHDIQGVAESPLATTVSGQADHPEEENEDIQARILFDKQLSLLEDITGPLITFFAGKILASVTGTSGFQDGDDYVNRIADSLPALLKQFSRELSQSAQSGIQKGTASFVRQYRRHIANSFRTIVANIKHKDPSHPPQSPFTLAEKIALWRMNPADSDSKTDKLPTDIVEYATINNGSEMDFDYTLPDDLDQRKWLFENEAYDRLLTMIQTASVRTSPEKPVVQSVVPPDARTTSPGQETSAQILEDGDPRPTEQLPSISKGPDVLSQKIISPEATGLSPLDGEPTPIPFNADPQDGLDRGRPVFATDIQITSRSSSLSSVPSLASSKISKSSASSLHSFGSQINIPKRLFEILWLDTQLQDLFKESLTKVSLQRFEDNFRKCLVQFAAHLRLEAASPSADKQTINAARVVRNLSGRTAHRIRDSLEAANKTDRDEAVLLVPNSNQQEDSDTELSSDEDIKEDLDADDEPNGLKDLETRLKSSNSFQMLIENFRLFVRPDLIQRSLFQIWPVTSPRSLPLEIKYQVEWEVQKFIQGYFPEGQKLGEVLTLTGEPFDAQALSCRDYITATWPGVGSLLLEGLEMLSPNCTEVPVQNSLASLTLKFLEGASPAVESKLCVTTVAKHSVHSDLISAISWICAAVRHSDFDTVANSSSFVEAKKLSGGDKSIFLKLKPLHPIQDSAGACWHILFPHAVIARGFPIRNREEGKGLEISFPDMLQMSRSLSFVEYDSGLIVEGLRSLLVPVTELTADNALQWHYMDRIKRATRRTALVSNVLAANKISSWYKELDPQRLIGRRCFLGWAEETHIAMGTEAYSTTKIKQSGAALAPKERRTRSHSFTLGTSGTGFVTATATIALTTTAMPSRIMLPHHQDVSDFLADGFDNHVLLFDTEAKTGWCLPLPSLTLYLTRLIITRRRYEIYDGSAMKALAFANPSSDGASSAAEVLKAYLDLKVRKFQSKETFSLSETVRQVLHSLNKVGTGLEDAAEEFEDARAGAPRYIHGVEFIDVFRNKDSLRIKQVEVNQPWAYLTKHQPIVLFGADLGQPIIACHPNTLCDLWRTVPRERNYLAATAIAVRYFLEEQGESASRLEDRVEWILEKSVIQSHRHGSASPVLHIQRLRTVKGAPRLNGGIFTIIERHLKAGFVFAKDTRQSRRRCAFQLPAGTPAIDRLRGDIPEIPEFASFTSEESTQSSDIDLELSISSHDFEETPESNSTDSTGEILHQSEPQTHQSLSIHSPETDGMSLNVQLKKCIGKELSSLPHSQSCDVPHPCPTVQRSVRRKKKCFALRPDVSSNHQMSVGSTSGRLLEMIPSFPHDAAEPLTSIYISSKPSNHRPPWSGHIRSSFQEKSENA